MGNLGKATAKIEFYASCHNINPKPNWQTFDLCGSQLRTMVNQSTEMNPIGIRFIEDGDWCGMMLSEYKTEFDNYLKIGEQAKDAGTETAEAQRSATRLEWSVNGVADALTKTTSTTDPYYFWQKKFKTDADSKLVSSVLPKWKTSYRPKQKNKQNAAITSTTTVSTSQPTMVSKIEQFAKDPSIVWGAQTKLMFGSVPYYIEVATADREAKDSGISDFILIRINSKGIDILCQDSKIYICDWNNEIYYDQSKGMVVADDQTNTSNPKGPILIDTGLQYNSKANAVLNFGIMPCIGKLVVFSDTSYFIYSRITSKVDSTTNQTSPPEFDPFILKSDTINVFGSNCTATVCVSAMEFEDKGLAVPSIYGAGVYGSAKRDQKYGIYQTSSSTTNTTKIIDLDKEYPRYYLFKGNGGQMCIGASCEKWGTDNFEPLAKTGDFLKLHDPPRGNIFVTWEKSKEKPNDWNVMNIRMEPTNIVQTKGEEGSTGVSDFKLDSATVLKSGTPFLYRLRGYYDGNETSTTSNSPLCTSYSIVSLNDKYECQEVYSASQSVDVTLYLDDDLRSQVQLDKKSYGVKIYLSWITSNAKIQDPFFTGVTLDTSFSEIAGKETITIHCEDYMRILADNVILNSPFYDGQDWFDSIVDIATMGGIEIKKDDTNETTRYYLPSGYSFQEPRMKFPQNQTLKDCITDITKLCEKVVYFNAVGELHCTYLQGGLAFSGAGVNISDDFKFYRDPSKNDANIILDEKKLEKLIGSTVNQVFVTSIDRGSGLPLVVSHVQDRNIPTDWNTTSTYKAVTDGIVPPYKKILFYEQNAFGNLQATQNWVAMIIERVYKVPSRISFKTITSQIIPPLTFIMVDGKKFRTTSCNRSYNAEDNSLVTTISAEWLGDPDSQ
jgi:hypothetical protein